MSVERKRIVRRMAWRGVLIGWAVGAWAGSGLVMVFGLPPGEPVAAQREWDAQYDLQGIRAAAAMRSDTGPGLLVIPAALAGDDSFRVAETPPRVEFAIVQGLEPRYLSQPERGTAVWGGWGDVARDRRGRFYFSLGNHIGYGAEAYVLRYDPVTQTQSVVFSAREVVGWGPDDYGDSKLHGYLDLTPEGDMWILSFATPRPTETEWDTVYRGGWLMRYNVETEETESLGVPLEGATWPYHAHDHARHMLFGVDHDLRYVMAYDTRERQLRYGGAPPAGIRWNNRAVLLDADTGLIYGTDIPVEWNRRQVSTLAHHFVRYDPRRNRIERLPVSTPPHPRDGGTAPLRAHTRRKDAEGAFWCFDSRGVMFRFFPAENRVETVGLNWQDGKYTTALRLSPGGRYLYYIPGADTKAQAYGTPVVQYDIHTGRRKVLAFLYPYYLETYGYGPGGTYGLELAADGASLFFYTNGKFTAPGQRTWYGRPAIFHLHIPASERQE